MKYEAFIKKRDYEKLENTLVYIIGTTLTLLFWIILDGALWLATVFFFYFGINSDQNTFMMVNFALSIITFFMLGPIIFLFFGQELTKMRDNYEKKRRIWGKKWTKSGKK